MHPRIPLVTFCTLVFLSACSDTPTAPVSAGADRGLVRSDAAREVAPPVSSPHGRSYAEWAAAWWQWALGNPATGNPLLDPTGDACATGQSGHVWFLAGTLASDAVTRDCTIPQGTALLVPLINIAYFAFLNDSPETRTEEFIRSQVTCIEDAEFALVELDGRPVRDPAQYFERSVVFSVVLPEDNLFGATETQIPELTLSPSVDAGYYLFLHPLPPGEHTVRWQASSAECGFAQDITYHLTVG